VRLRFIECYTIGGSSNVETLSLSQRTEYLITKHIEPADNSGLEPSGYTNYLSTLTDNKLCFPRLSHVPLSDNNTITHARQESRHTLHRFDITWDGEWSDTTRHGLIYLSTGWWQDTGPAISTDLHVYWMMLKTLDQFLRSQLACTDLVNPSKQWVPTTTNNGQIM